MKAEEQLKEWIEDCSNIVFFGGAGVSTESGIPDFRSVDGLYNQKYKYPPEMIISHSFYKKNPEEFYRFYKDRMIFRDAEPNRAHRALARLEEMGKLKAVVTQNIDGLHQKAGSREVWNFTVRSTAITVPDAINFTIWMRLWLRKACPGVPVAE